MVLGIDLSNIRLGGGITHIKELLSNIEGSPKSFHKIIVWGSLHTLGQLPSYPWLFKNAIPSFENGLMSRFFWQTFRLSKAAKKEGCSILFVPGGTFLGTFTPVVVMSQNLLPFELKEIWRFRYSARGIKFILLRYLQSISLRRAAGAIFLTEYAKRISLGVIGKINGEAVVISHGLAERFKKNIFLVKPFPLHESSTPIKIIYVSNIDLYKHQRSVLQAVFYLRSLGYSISIEFIGPAVKRALRDLNDSLSVYDPEAIWAKYLGEVSYDKISGVYDSADLAVFASSCETFGITLLEKMASGLPIACSMMSSMPEILQEGGLYFDPESPLSIADSIEKYILSDQLREDKQRISYELSKNYSWKVCSDQTFTFLEKIASDAKC